MLSSDSAQSVSPRKEEKGDETRDRGKLTPQADPHNAQVRALKQPPFHPPPQVFGPVWAALYGLVGYAAYRAVPKDPASGGLYTLQLGLTLAWMPLFFKLHRPIEATVDAVALVGINSYLAVRWLETAGTAVAGWCMVPYVAWLGLAAYLSAGVGHLNGWSLSSLDEKKE